MKNLFYVCLVAMLSLGSTGFTTVEDNFETGCEFSCGMMAQEVWEDEVAESGSAELAKEEADAFFSFCNGVWCDLNN